MLVYLRDGSDLTHWDRSQMNFQPHPVTVCDTGQTSPSVDPIMPGAWVATGVPFCKSLVWLDPEKSSRTQDSNPRSSALQADALTTKRLYTCQRGGRLFGDRYSLKTGMTLRRLPATDPRSSSWVVPRNMLVYRRDISHQTSVRAATLR